MSHNNCGYTYFSWRNEMSKTSGHQLRVKSGVESLPTSVTFANGKRCKLTAKQAEQVALLLDEEEMLSPEQAARLLCVSRPMVVRWINEGLLPDTPAGTHHRIPKSAVLSLRDQRRHAGVRAVALIAASKSDSGAARKTAFARVAAAQRVAKLTK